MDQELIAYLDQHFRGTAGQIEALRQETAQQLVRIDGRLERVETEVRHAHVVIEGLRDEVHLLAEGMIGFDERMGGLRAEVKEQLEEMRSWMHQAYRGLDRRVEDLEVSQENRQRATLDVIREKFGKPRGGV